MERNWKLDKNETLKWNGRTLYRVVLTEDCEYGNAGDKMGWIEKEENLQDDAIIKTDIKIGGMSEITGNTIINYK